jgi:YegS/Rv2252/BmrU family lipid kinase
MQAALIINPTSGISSVTEQPMSPQETERTILEGLRAYNIEPQVYQTTPEDTGGGLARHLAEEQAELVIAAGGDGTIHAVASGLVGSNSIMGIIPTGTMNNLAHSLNVPDTIPDACTAIATGVTRTIDVGKVNDHIFIEVAGVGLEASLFPAAEEIKHPGFLSTMHGAIRGLKTLLDFKPTRLSILDGFGRIHYTALEVTICNAPFYGAHLQIAPTIHMDDGLLDVVIYRNFSKLEYLRHAISISQGRRPYQPKIQFLRVQSLHINAAQPLDIQADGEVIGTTPANVTILPKALRVRVSGKPAPGLEDLRRTAKITTPIYQPSRKR